MSDVCDFDFAVHFKTSCLMRAADALQLRNRLEVYVIRTFTVKDLIENTRQLKANLFLNTATFVNSRTS